MMGEVVQMKGLDLRRCEGCEYYRRKCYPWLEKCAYMESKDAVGDCRNFEVRKVSAAKVCYYCEAPCVEVDYCKAGDYYVCRSCP